MVVRPPSTPDAVVNKTVNSIKVSMGDTGSLSVIGPNEVDDFLQGVKSEFFHPVKAGSIILPDFYKACLQTLKTTGKDYVFTSALDVTGDCGEIFTPPSKYINGQIVCRSWMVREIDPVTLKYFFDISFKEYKGEPVPSTLCVNFWDA